MIENAAKVSELKIDGIITAMRFGTFSREESSLVMVHKVPAGLFRAQSSLSARLTSASGCTGWGFDNQDAAEAGKFRGGNACPPSTTDSLLLVLVQVSSKPPGPPPEQGKHALFPPSQRL